MIKIVFTFFLLLFYIDAKAQDTVDPNSSLACTKFNKWYRKEWTNVGIGGTDQNVLNGISGINAGISSHWMMKRFTYDAGFNTTSSLFSGDNTITVFNAGIGKSISKRVYLLNISAGPGIMWGKKTNESSSEFRAQHFVTGGIVFKAEAIIKLIKNFRLGFELFSNINTIQSSSGIRFVIHLNNDK